MHQRSLDTPQAEQHHSPLAVETSSHNLMSVGSGVDGPTEPRPVFCRANTHTLEL